MRWQGLSLMVVGAVVAACGVPVGNIGAEPPTTAPPTTSTTLEKAPSATAFPVPTKTITKELLQGEPEVRLLPLAPHRGRSESGEYFDFVEVVGTDSYTTTVERVEVSAEGEDRMFLQLAINGNSGHYVATYGADTDEYVFTSNGVWSRAGDDDEWTEGEGNGEALAFAWIVIPNMQYSLAYRVFESLTFSGWTEVEGSRVAVYEGDTSEASAALAEMGGEGDLVITEGTILVTWDPIGYFRQFRIEAAGTDPFEPHRGDISVLIEWIITEVGTTEVEEPNS